MCVYVFLAYMYVDYHVSSVAVCALLKYDVERTCTLSVPHSNPKCTYKRSACCVESKGPYWTAYFDKAAEFGGCLPLGQCSVLVENGRKWRYTAVIGV